MTLYQIHAPHSISNSWDIPVPRNNKPKETTLNVTRTKCSDECVKPSSIIALHWYWIFGIASVTCSQLIGIIIGKKVKLSKLHGEIPVHLINMTISTRFRRLKDIENCKTVFFFESELQLRWRFHKWTTVVCRWGLATWQALMGLEPWFFETSTCSHTMFISVAEREKRESNDGNEWGMMVDVCKLW